MILGCAQKSNVVGLSAALVTDTAAIRCPAASARDAQEARRWVGVPKPDAKTAAGEDTYSVAALQQWIDRHEAGQYRKNRVLRRVLDEYAKCRGETKDAKVS